MDEKLISNDRLALRDQYVGPGFIQLTRSGTQHALTCSKCRLKLGEIYDMFGKILHGVRADVAAAALFAVVMETAEQQEKAELRDALQRAGVDVLVRGGSTIGNPRPKSRPPADPYPR